LNDERLCNGWNHVAKEPTNLNWPTNYVSGLIKENKWEWRKSFVDSNFNPRDVTCILAMLLCDGGSRGRFELKNSPTNVYTVKSGYHM